MRDKKSAPLHCAGPGPRVRPSKKGPPPTEAFRAVSTMDMPFILGGAPCPAHRYSVVGAGPFMRLTLPAEGGTMEIRDMPPWLRDTMRGIPLNDPFDVLSRVMGALKGARARAGGSGPFPFSGGAAGIFSYDLKDIIFKLPPNGPEKKGRGIGLPLMDIGIYNNLYVYDHEEERGYFISPAREDDAAEDFQRRIEGAGTGTRPTPGAVPGSVRQGDAPPRLSSNTTRDAYLQGLKRAKEYIAAGDIYQANLSQRLSAPFTGEPFGLYEALIKENPTPFSSYFDPGGFQVISNSPERLLRMEGSAMETCPIKGTRPRGMTPAEDTRLMEELARSPKERAEHVMIVDLERNDLGMVSLPGTVQVENFQEIQTFTRLHHMVSTVRGTAPAGADPVLILKKIFPGGSITGAPKIRAMEIIEELESVPREIYTGSAGYIDFSGNADLSILIRTAVIKDNKIILHVGGGIVADSDPGAEYDETILKAMDFLSLLNLAEGMPA